MSVHGLIAITVEIARLRARLTSRGWCRIPDEMAVFFCNPILGTGTRFTMDWSSREGMEVGQGGSRYPRRG